MKRITSIAAILILLLFAFPTPVGASPGVISEPSFETVTSWTYSEDDADYTDGAQSTLWAKQGTYSYLLSALSTVTIANGKYSQTLQSVNFDTLDTICFDAQLDAGSDGYFEARVIVGTTTVWFQACTITEAEYLHQEVDVSGYTGSQDLIFQVIAVATAKNIGTNVYFDNIKTWGSFTDATHTTVDNLFSGGENTVYMYGENFAASQLYSVAFYDPSTPPNNVATVSLNSTAIGDLSAQYLLTTDPAAEAGIWHAVVYKNPNTPPTGYTADDPNRVVEDDFDVTAEAIPEFPTVMAGIVVAGLCFGIYYWMRKRRLAYVKA